MHPNSRRLPAAPTTHRFALLATLASVFALAASAAPPAAAEPTRLERGEICRRDGIRRVVELREDPDGGLPCEVVYLKPDEDRSARVLWAARADRAFCTARYEAFIVKLETELDWSCESPDGASVSADDVRPAEPDPVPAAAASSSRPIASSIGSSAVETAVEGISPELAAARGGTSEFATAVGPESASPLASDSASEPPLARAAVAVGVPTDADGASDRLAELQTLVPSGPYASVPIPLPGREDDARIAPFCPPGGPLFWNVRDRQRPVLELGANAELPVRLPDTALDESFVLEADPSVAPEPGATRELQTLSLAPTSPDREGRVIDIRVAPRGPGSGALSPGVCRYALGGG